MSINEDMTRIRGEAMEKVATGIGLVAQGLNSLSGVLHSVAQAMEGISEKLVSDAVDEEFGDVAEREHEEDAKDYADDAVEESEPFAPPLTDEIVEQSGPVGDAVSYTESSAGMPPAPPATPFH